MMYLMKLYFRRAAGAGAALLVAGLLAGCVVTVPDPDPTVTLDEQTARAQLRDMVDRATTTVLGVWTEEEEGPLPCSSDAVTSGAQWRISKAGPGVADGQQREAAQAAAIIFGRIGDYSSDLEETTAEDGTMIVTVSYIGYDFKEDAGFSLDYVVGTAETTVTGTTVCIERAA
ncbi:hypothetical protein BH10ACT7_BH10ACT7_28720 [soil metagenome]